MICVIVCLDESISYTLKLLRLVAITISKERQGRQIAIAEVPGQIRRWILSRYNRDRKDVQRVGSLGWVLGNDGIMPQVAYLLLNSGGHRYQPRRGA
jgi:hypothetical protein